LPPDDQGADNATTVVVERRVPSETDSPAAEPVARGEQLADHGGLSLLWRLFLANAAVLALVVVLLAVTPITITAPIVTLEQLLILLAGLIAMLAIDLVLLRRILAPLRRVTELMHSIDPDQPGRRIDDVGPRHPDAAKLAAAFNEMLDRLETERRESARVALAAQERERLRIARELHDEIGQSLTAVGLKAEHAADNGSADPAAELRRLADDIRNSLDDVRRIARELRPEALDDLGLVNALITLCSHVGAQGGPRVERQLQAGLPALSPDVELVVYRVAQESLTNVVRHARAKRATVSLNAEDGAVVLRVRDDGRGLPPELPKGTSGVGGMRERALLVGGKLTISSEPDRGTEVTLEVPGGEAGE
jgi:two-component system, NarL family, sensor histidine kinase UhpB